MNPLNAPRPGLSESAFRRFEPVIETAVLTGSCTCDLSSSNLSPHTVAARLRDALRAKRLYDYPSSVSAKDVSRLYVVETTDSVLLCDRNTPQAQPMMAAAQTPTAVTSLTVNNPAVAVIHAVCVLCHHRLLYEVIITSEHEQLHKYVAEYAAGYDVIAVRTGNTTTIH